MGETGQCMQTQVYVLRKSWKVRLNFFDVANHVIYCDYKHVIFQLYGTECLKIYIIFFWAIRGAVNVFL